MNEGRLRERLAAAAASVRIDEPPIERSLSRGLRRLRLRRFTAGATAMVLIAGTAWSLFALRGLEPERRSAALTELGEITRIPMPGVPQFVAATDEAAWTMAPSGRGRGVRGETVYRVDRASGEVRELYLGGFAMGIGAEDHRAWAIVCERFGTDQAENGCAESVLVEMDEAGEVVARTPLGTAYSPNQAVLVGEVAAVQTGDGMVVVRDGRIGRTIACCRGVLAGGFGSVWSTTEDAVYRADPDTGAVDSIPEPDPCPRYGALDAGAGGVWVAGCDSRVWRIDPATNTASRPIEGGFRNTIAAGSGSAWLVGRTNENNQDIEIRRVDPATLEVGPVTTIPGSVGPPKHVYSCGLCSGGDPLLPAIGGGTLWLANFTGGELIRIDLRSKDEPPPPSPRPAVEHYDMDGRPIRAVAVGFGAAWITVQSGVTGRMELTRMDRATGAVARVTAAGEAGEVVLGGGWIWTATCAHPGMDQCTETKIVRIDPVSLQATAETPIEDPVFGIAYGAGSVWVTVSDGRYGHLLRIDPDTTAVVSRIDGWACCSGTVFGEGALWSLGSGGGFDGELTSLDAATEEVRELPKFRPRFRFGGHLLAVGEGAVWVTLGIGGRSPVARIDPVSGEITAMADAAWFGWFAAGEGGVWFARPAEGSTRCIEVLRVDPTDAGSQVVGVLDLANEGHGTLGIGGPLIGVGAGDGDLWITVDETWEVIRVDVQSLFAGSIRDPGCAPTPESSPS